MRGLNQNRKELDIVIYFMLNLINHEGIIDFMWKNSSWEFDSRSTRQEILVFV
jgi:hypothetical protein